MWENQHVKDENVFLLSFKQTLIDCFTQEWHVYLQTNSVLILYKAVKERFEYESYLDVFSNIKLRQFVTKIRLSSHNLHIETGRYGRNRLPRHERMCQICDENEIENEFHFMLKCSKYSQLRTRLIPVYYHRRPSMLKFTELIKCKNTKILNNLGQYICQAFEVRTNCITNGL